MEQQKLNICGCGGMADAQVSGTCGGNTVRVRPSPSAPDSVNDAFYFKPFYNEFICALIFFFNHSHFFYSELISNIKTEKNWFILNVKIKRLRRKTQSNRSVSYFFVAKLGNKLLIDDEKQFFDVLQLQFILLPRNKHLESIDC